jgi:hypothetical protein
VVELESMRCMRCDIKACKLWRVWA